MIFYHIDLKEYFVKDLCNGFGTFVRINSSTLLKQNSLFNIGDTYIVVTFTNEKNIIQNGLLPNRIINIAVFSSTIKKKIQ